MKNTISLLCPTRGRPDKAIRLAFSVLKTAVDPNRVEILFYADADDLEKSNYIHQFEQNKPELNRLMRCLLLIGEPIGISKAWNELAARSQGNLLVMAADDQTYNDVGWDDRLDEEVQKFPDQIFCMWFNDGHWQEKLCTFPIVSRKWCLTLGYFTTGLFECLYDDLWIMDLAKRLDRLHYIPDVLTEHLHWSYGKSEIDSTYKWKQVNAQGQLKPTVQRDMNLFGRTTPYRETDAKRLASVMSPAASLKAGLAQIGKPSIFELPPVLQTAPASGNAAKAERLDRPNCLELVTLYLPGHGANFKMQLDTAISDQEEMFCEFRQGRFYKSQISQLLIQVLALGDCFVEVGAHIGYFSLLAALKVGDRGSVFAVEMEPNNYSRLLQNAQLNQFNHLHSFQVALGSEPKKTQPIAIETLDRLLRDRPIQNLKLIKIEAEGAEHEVLKGSIDTLLFHRVPYILCEINRFRLQQTGTNEAALRRLMASIGYDAYLLQPDIAELTKLSSEQYCQSESAFQILFTSRQSLL